MSCCVSRGGDYMRKHSSWGVLDPSTEMEGFGQCLWNVESNKQFTNTPSNDAKTLVEVLEKTKSKFGARRGIGWRDVVKVHEIEEQGAKREKIELANEYRWLTYQEYYDRVYLLARGFACLGVTPMSKVVIYAETQPDWMATAFASWYSNCQIVTIYATLGPDGALHGINETEAETIVVDAKLLKIVSKILPKCKSVKRIITIGNCDEALADQIKKAGTVVRSVDSVVDLGKTWSFSPTLPKPQDVSVIMYTSGTTGPPKGVVITHANIVATMAGVEHFLQGMVTCEDTYLCYLPLAHIFELGAELSFLSMGTSLGFGSPHTLTDSGVKLKRPESIGDAPCLQPTFMVFAPAVLDKVYQSVQNKKDTLSNMGKKMFRWGSASGTRRYARDRIGANCLYNKLVFKKVQQLVGGRLRGCVTGSAPLSPDIQKFIQTVLNIPVRQGYGLTETCAGSCIGFWGDNSTACVGPPTICTTIRLADWPEGNYMNSDKDKPEIGMRRGEVLIGGPAVSQGYYISERAPNPDLLKKNEDDYVEIQGIRYFRTGDVAQLKPDGSLQIIDRKKDLWKGPNGEYVALTKVESALKMCDFVEMPMVYGKTGGEFPIALICPQKPRIMQLCAEIHGAQASISFETLCNDPQIVKRVGDACKAICKEQKLVAFEIPTKFALIADLWTPDNDMLTAAMKLKRPAIAAKHKEDIDRLYAKEQAPKE